MDISHCSPRERRPGKPSPQKFMRPVGPKPLNFAFAGHQPKAQSPKPARQRFFLASPFTRAYLYAMIPEAIEAHEAKPHPEIAPKLRILTLRNQRVLLDADLARLYAVETRALNQAVKRNADRFPPEFAFPLTREEILSISQSVTSLAQLKFYKRVQAFTEHGALQAANVLNTPQAVRMSLYIVRAFMKLREELAANATILKRLAEIDKKLLEHDTNLRALWMELQPLLAPPPEPPPAPPRRIKGFNPNAE